MVLWSRKNQGEVCVLHCSDGHAKGRILADAVELDDSVEAQHASRLPILFYAVDGGTIGCLWC